MVIKQFLMQSSYNSNPFFQQQIKGSSSSNKTLNWSYTRYNVIRSSSKLRIKCIVTNHMREGHKGINGIRVREYTELKKVVDTGCYINKVFWRSIKNVVKALQKPVITGFILGLLLLYDHRYSRLALAASGGSMGWSSFSDSSSSFSSSSSDDEDSQSYTTESETPKSEVEAEADQYSALFILILIVMLSFCEQITGGDKTSVLKLQVGLLGTARSLQWDLNGFAKKADTSTREGLMYILQEATQALLRHPDYCISGYSSVYVRSNMKEAEKLFKDISVEERGKFGDETLVNVNNFRKEIASSQSSNGVSNEYIVVTIIVAAKGKHELPPIKSIADMKKALQMLASVPSSNIKAGQVLWTPQQDNDCLTEKEMRKDYPLLQPL